MNQGGIVDLHSHILPGVDDGAGDVEESLAMAGLAVKEGIRVLAVTPHHNNPMYRNRKADILEQMRMLQEQITTAGIDLQLVAGQELRLCETSMRELLTGDEVLTLNASRYLLVELPSNDIPDPLEEWMHEFRVKGIVPVIAHPERNRAIIEDPRRLDDLLSWGALAQVTAPSLLGQFGGKVKHVAMQLCRDHKIHLVASDAHHPSVRTFALQQAFSLIADTLGDSYKELYLSNAERMLANEDVEIEYALKPRRNRLFFWKR